MDVPSGKRLHNYGIFGISKMMKWMFYGEKSWDFSGFPVIHDVLMMFFGWM